MRLDKGNIYRSEACRVTVSPVLHDLQEATRPTSAAEDGGPAV